MASSAEAVATLLNTSALSTDLTSGTNLFIGLFQESPDLQCAVRQSDGSQPHFTFGTKVVDLPRVEVGVRGGVDGYIAAEALCSDIINTLDLAAPGVYTGLSVLRFEPLGSAHFAGIDSLDRPIFTARFIVKIQRA